MALEILVPIIAVFVFIIVAAFVWHIFEKLIKLKPALSLKTRIVYLKDAPEGRLLRRTWRFCCLTGARN